ncbi:MAG: response regulator [Thermodesulfovibrionales bacterium]|nr:response regulator [Thermodesulfovibrionales bacterium]
MINNTQQYQIVVVEDSPVQLEYICDVLEKQHYNVKGFIDAKDALEYIKSTPPSLIITDVVMPEISGFDFCKRIKSQKSTKHIPVILLTALSEPEDIITGLEVGADTFITKPFSNRFLLSRIEYCLINSKIRKNISADVGIEIVFRGKKHFINSTKIQILDLLLSTYESAVEKNKELEAAIKELKKTQAELIEAKELADTANRHKSEFLATMSHEIRTPMNVIIGISQLLLDSDMSDENKEQLQILKNAAQSLLNILSDILDISKIESGVTDVEEIDFNIQSLIDEIKSYYQILANQKGLVLNASISQDIPQYIRSDYTKIKQILWNLVSNAIKFTEKGHVDIKVQRGDIQSSDTLPSDTIPLQFCISDTGIGIPPRKKAHIFESFTQVDSSTTRKYGGTGLGLSICKGLVSLLGGSIDVESEVGKGSTFYFTIPVKASSMTKKDAEESQQREALDKKPTRSLNILVVDDNELNLLIASRLLTKKGHAVTTANDGNEAIKLLQKDRFDMVFMDINMPEMDGYDTTRMIRKIGIMTDGKPIPIIAMTAYAMKGDKEKCIEAGMDDYIAKPIDAKQLYELLENYT